MLSSIHPFGERSRHSRWSVTVATYMVASTAAGAGFGLLLGLLSLGVRAVVPPAGAAALFATACLWGFAADLGRTPWSYPNWRRQVNEVWLNTYRGWVYGAGFGFQLGLGVVTIVTTATVWLTWLAAVLVGSPWAGLAIGTTFGFVRAVLLLSTARINAPDQLRRLHRTIARQAAPVHRIAVAASLLAGLAAATTLFM